MIYFNNAATSFPKPDAVRRAVADQLDRPAVDAGRGGLSVPCPVDALRRDLAELMGVSRPERIAVTPSATYAINTVIFGLLGADKGGHVVATALEHNSVLRPLAHLEERGAIRLTVVPTDASGAVAAADVEGALTVQTRLVCVSHASNANGAVQDIGGMAKAAARAGVPLLIDASQSAGALPIDHGALEGRVFIAVAGHKALYGPTGVGALVVPDGALPQSFVGGTGVRSESRLHPEELPLRHEAGTANLIGAAGLRAGVAFVRERTVEALGEARQRLVSQARRLLAEIPRIHLVKAPGADGRAGIVAFGCDGIPVSDVGFALRESFDIACRDGLHCAPLAHRALGTWPEGTVRFGFGAFNTEEEVARAVEAVRALCAA